MRTWKHTFTGTPLGVDAGIDREAGYMTMNETVRLTDAEVNGRPHIALILNRIGYACVRQMPLIS